MRKIFFSLALLLIFVWSYAVILEILTLKHAESTVPIQDDPESDDLLFAETNHDPHKQPARGKPAFAKPGKYRTKTAPPIIIQGQPKHAS